MRAVFWDTNLFIYLIEELAPFFERVVALRQDMRAQGDLLTTSTLTLGEVLAKPLQFNRQDLVQQYRAILGPPTVH